MVTFFLMAAFAVAGGILVVTARQPIHAALALVVTLLAVAVAYVTLDAHFLAAIQVIVYAGAVMVLFLFVIMLLNVERQSPTARWRWLRPSAYGFGLLALVAVAIVVVNQRQAGPTPTQVSEVLQGGSAERIGTVLFSDYLLAFHLVAVLLLTGIIGAVSLVQRAGRPDESAGPATVPAASEVETA